MQAIVKGYIFLTWISIVQNQLSTHFNKSAGSGSMQQFIQINWATWGKESRFWFLMQRWPSNEGQGRLNTYQIEEFCGLCSHNIF